MFRRTPTIKPLEIRGYPYLIIVNKENGTGLNGNPVGPSLDNGNPVGNPVGPSQLLDNIINKP
jgi:hypothetical protein